MSAAGAAAFKHLGSAAEAVAFKHLGSAAGAVVFKQLGSAIELCDYFVQNILPRNPALNARGATHTNTPESERVMLCEMFEADERIRCMHQMIGSHASDACIRRLNQMVESAD